MNISGIHKNMQNNTIDNKKLSKNGLPAKNKKTKEKDINKEETKELKKDKTDEMKMVDFWDRVKVKEMSFSDTIYVKPKNNKNKKEDEKEDEK